MRRTTGRRWLARGRGRRRAMRMALLALPALFWSAVFASVAGAGPLGGAVEAVPDALQAAVTLACPLAAMLLGADALRAEGRGGAGLRSPGVLMVAAGAALFAFAAYVALGAA